MLSIRNYIDIERHGYSHGFIIVFLVLLSLLLMARQLATNQYYSCIVADTFTYTGWAWQFKEALMEGVSYPRWMPRNYWGYGGPTFILYPPLAFYITSLYSSFTDSLIMAMNLTKLTSLSLSGIGMYFLAKELFSKRAALFSAILYITLPYHMMQYYVLGGFASIVSFMWFAPLLLFTHRCLEGRGYRYLAFAGLCYGGLVVTHPINAYMFTFVLGLFVTVTALVKRRALDILILPSIILTGFLVAAAYTIPFFMEKNLLKLDTFITEGSGYAFSNYFILPHVENNASGNPFWSIYYQSFVTHTLLLCLMILIISLLIFISKHGVGIRNDHRYYLFLTVSIFSISLLFGVSSFIWEGIPYFQYIQFPVRWLHITIFTVPMLFAYCLDRLESEGLAGAGFMLTVAGFLLCCGVFDYRIVNGACSFTERELFPVRTVDCSIEHMPRGVDPDLLDKTADPHVSRVLLNGKGIADIVMWSSAQRIVNLKAQDKLVVRFRTFNYPGWTARLDGSPTEIRSEAGTTAILVDVPAGKHRLELVFQDTSARRAGKMISLVSIIAFLVIIIRHSILKGTIW